MPASAEVAEKARTALGVAEYPDLLSLDTLRLQQALVTARAVGVAAVYLNSAKEKLEASRVAHGAIVRLDVHLDAPSLLDIDTERFERDMDNAREMCFDNVRHVGVSELCRASPEVTERLGRAMSLLVEARTAQIKHRAKKRWGISRMIANSMGPMLMFLDTAVMARAVETAREAGVDEAELSAVSTRLIDTSKIQEAAKALAATYVGIPLMSINVHKLSRAISDAKMVGVPNVLIRPAQKAHAAALRAQQAKDDLLDLIRLNNGDVRAIQMLLDAARDAGVPEDALPDLERMSSLGAALDERLDGLAAAADDGGEGIFHDDDALEALRAELLAYEEASQGCMPPEVRARLKRAQSTVERADRRARERREAEEREKRGLGYGLLHEKGMRPSRTKTLPGKLASSSHGGGANKDAGWRPFDQSEEDEEEEDLSSANEENDGDGSDDVTGGRGRRSHHKHRTRQHRDGRSAGGEGGRSEASTGSGGYAFRGDDGDDRCSYDMHSSSGETRKKKTEFLDAFYAGSQLDRFGRVGHHEWAGGSAVAQSRTGGAFLAGSSQHPDSSDVLFSWGGDKEDQVRSGSDGRRWVADGGQALSHHMESMDWRDREKAQQSRHSAPMPPRLAPPREDADEPTAEPYERDGDRSYQARQVHMRAARTSATGGERSEAIDLGDREASVSKRAAPLATHKHRIGVVEAGGPQVGDANPSSERRTSDDIPLRRGRSDASHSKHSLLMDWSEKESVPTARLRPNLRNSPTRAVGGANGAVISTAPASQPPACQTSISKKVLEKTSMDGKKKKKDTAAVMAVVPPHEGIPMALTLVKQPTPLHMDEYVSPAHMADESMAASNAPSPSNGNASPSQHVHVDDVLAQAPLPAPSIPKHHHDADQPALPSETPMPPTPPSSPHHTESAHPTLLRLSTEEVMADERHTSEEVLAAVTEDRQHLDAQLELYTTLSPLAPERVRASPSEAQMGQSPSTTTATAADKAETTAARSASRSADELAKQAVPTSPSTIQALPASSAPPPESTGDATPPILPSAPEPKPAPHVPSTRTLDDQLVPPHRAPVPLFDPVVLQLPDSRGSEPPWSPPADLLNRDAGKKTVTYSRSRAPMLDARQPGSDRHVKSRSARFADLLPAKDSATPAISATGRSPTYQPPTPTCQMALDTNRHGIVFTPLEAESEMVALYGKLSNEEVRVMRLPSPPPRSYRPRPPRTYRSSGVPQHTAGLLRSSLSLPRLHSATVGTFLPDLSPTGPAHVRADIMSSSVPSEKRTQRRRWTSWHAVGDESVGFSSLVAESARSCAKRAGRLRLDDVDHWSLTKSKSEPMVLKAVRVQPQDDVPNGSPTRRRESM